MDDLETISRVFNRIAPIELAYKHLSDDPEAIFKDIRDTALCLATRGNAGQGDFDALQKGVSFIRPFMYQSKYHIEDAITDAAKAACLATSIERGAKAIPRYDKDRENPVLQPTFSNKLNKLRVILPEAYYYWALTSQMLL